MEMLRPKKEGIPSPGSAAPGGFQFSHLLGSHQLLVLSSHCTYIFLGERFLCFVFCRVTLIFHHSSCDFYDIVAVTSFVHRIEALSMSINILFSLLICSNQHDHQSKSLRFFVGSLDFLNILIHSK